MSFLTASWKKLCFANYTIDPEILKPYVPAHTELDFYEGKCYVSLVGFLFDDVKLKGITIPFHKRFEEINLRFYVKYFNGKIWKRGTVFISEIVRKPAIAWVANLLYNEQYSVFKMHYKHDLTDEENFFSYGLDFEENWQLFQVATATKTHNYKPGSITEFITEHFWGYSKKNKNQTWEYEVRHPIWEAYKVLDYEVIFDFGKIYGSKFNELSTRDPDSVQCMEGSAISIEGKKLIKK
ncbi:hypothetical protein DSM03_103288 [Leeuwenhoekiella aestuarii]|uniref:DUF2071 domain-containing protein n=1 Tax=Leeuwenhoekiella aestuarii TaxID=2249426 RepID=A0A4Q0NX36_9FLAO|nr:DUF2071 domain-containing protein [Leeuwenhoekiella aestuarii]RXG16102.1 hypothetical protein DSM03_103288 [Leeuwenhoekiella aestuarii]RXG16796.1 hypothetical protein DSM04_102378 [Leeuwenhoekiella aestuarii]